MLEKISAEMPRGIVDVRVSEVFREFLIRTNPTKPIGNEKTAVVPIRARFKKSKSFKSNGLETCGRG